MSINLSIPAGAAIPDLKPKLTVIGVGGAGGNAVNNMIRRELEGVDFVVANTDAQALEQSQAEARIQLGANLTQGLGLDPLIRASDARRHPCQCVTAPTELDLQIQTI